MNSINCNQQLMNPVFRQKRGNEQNALNQFTMPQAQLKAVNPTNVINGVTASIIALTALVNAGISLKDAILHLFPNSSPKDRANLEQAVQKTINLDVAA